MAQSTAVRATPRSIDTDGSGITGPHYAADKTGDTYEYWRCEQCGLESSDPRLRDGCIRCE